MGTPYTCETVELSLLNTVAWGNGSPQIYFRSEGAEVEMSVDYCIIQDGEEELR